MIFHTPRVLSSTSSHFRHPEHLRRHGAFRLANQDSGRLHHAHFARQSVSREIRSYSSVPGTDHSDRVDTLAFEMLCMRHATPFELALSTVRKLHRL
jgi:hypothetical protein